MLTHPCASLFTAALFTIANIWKEPQCPSIGESIRKKSHTHTHTHTHRDTHNEILLSSKKESNLVIVDNMDGPEGMIPSETRHTEKDKYHTVLFICGTSEIK